MTGKTPSSDRHNGPPALAAPLTVLEGMPGAGKTTTGHRIAATGVQFVGEYTTGSGTTMQAGMTNPLPFGPENYQEKIRGVVALTLNLPVNQLN